VKFFVFTGRPDCLVSEFSIPLISALHYGFSGITDIQGNRFDGDNVEHFGENVVIGHHELDHSSA
jgi:hypothetical protein